MSTLSQGYAHPSYECSEFCDMNAKFGNEAHYARALSPFLYKAYEMFVIQPNPCMRALTFSL